MKILAISGSAREASTNTALLRAMKDIAPSSIEFSVFHSLNKLPIFSPDDEGEKTPAIVEEFIKSVSASDGIIISSPEYIRCIPGGLKNAIDWMVSRTEIIDKPIVLVHASSRGDDMLVSLRRVLSTVSSNFFEDLFLRISLLSKSPEQIIEMLQTEQYKSQITTFLLSFVSEIQKYQDQLE
ncbi:NAD(P)H-dependent oxidoreductase [Acinetobacter sp. IK31]|uniref:NADPH-dependent FMN reductase n=1 Tax=Acinetobacter sp. IK31 TaxID=2928895 RepID=UPI002D20FAB2|nr:NADPH-dependent FMN reductase [Acinetobacter sp. IK31]MEB3864597.1 NAD(P)H-dependent oxidoreductase [Acinetobacter sp. IK31]